MSPSEGSTSIKRKRNVSVSQSKKVKRNVPSAKELEDIREAEVLFHSSFFKMEVEELLREVKPKISEDMLDNWIQLLENFLMNIPETSQYQIDDFPVNIHVPIMKKVKTDKAALRFIPPTCIRRCGSFVYGTICSSEPVLDIAIEIPKSCWQSMDYLNERYHRKRALYLSHIAECLQTADFVKDLQFNYCNGCHLKPNLLIVPQGIENLTVSLAAYPSEEAFKLTRFVPTKNNVRSTWLLNKSEDDLEVPTPYYNATIQADLLIPKLHSFLEENIVSQNIRDGIILVKIWCMQRRLMSGYGRLNGFIITMFVAYLLKKGKLNTFMNSYQVFRCTLLALQHQNFGEGISLAIQGDNQPPLEDFQRLYSGVFIDETGYMNILYSVNAETLDIVKHEAKLGLKILDNELPNCFTFLFMNKLRALEKYEYLIHLKGPKKFRKYAKQLCQEKDNLNFGENVVAAVLPKICDILRKGLQKRVLLLDVIKDSSVAWPISDPPPSPNCGLVTIGLLLNPEVPINNIEKGPLADDPQAKEFREFWGNQSELRRFQDGSIREAVYWPANTVEEKRKVFSQMVKDILKRHVSAEGNDISVTGTEVDCVLHLPEGILSSDFPSYGTGEEAHVTLMQSFNSLSKQLRKLEDLPLMISSIQPISPAFHFSEVFPPLSLSYTCDKSICSLSDSKLKLQKMASTVPPFTLALEVIITFEGSGKWPDDVEAIKRVKTTFLIKIAELVKQKHSMTAVPYLTHVDIMKDGYVFRLMIACHKELYLMKQTKTPNGVVRIKQTEESRQLEIIIDTLPKLNSILHGLHQQHNTYGTACRLAKRWISSQFKWGYISDIAIELLVAYCYCHPEPYTCPSSPQAAFFRFLSLIVQHDWKTSPLIVNLNNELQKKDIEEIHSTFTSQRSTLPAMVIATPLDKRGNLWTRSKPHPTILKRITILAKAALETLQERMSNVKDFDIKLVFRPPLDSFDLILHLNHNAVAKLRYALDIQDVDELQELKPYKDTDDQIYPVINYNPAEKYLEELKVNFSEYAFFFYDVYGGDSIPVVWKKSQLLSKEVKAASRDSILQQFEILGKGVLKYTEKLKNL